MEERRRLMLEELPRLRRYARMLVRDQARADDLVQECLVRAIGALASFQPGTNMRAWLFTILRNTLYNETKRARRMVEQTEEPVSAVSGGQEEALAMRDVQRAFNSLPDIQKEVVLLVAVEGMEYEDAAAVLGVPVGTVKSRLSRARQDIRDFLNPARSKGGG